MNKIVIFMRGKLFSPAIKRQDFDIFIKSLLYTMNVRHIKNFIFFQIQHKNNLEQQHKVTFNKSRFNYLLTILMYLINPTFLTGFLKEKV